MIAQLNEQIEQLKYEKDEIVSIKDKFINDLKAENKKIVDSLKNQIEGQIKKFQALKEYVDPQDFYIKLAFVKTYTFGCSLLI